MRKKVRALLCATMVLSLAVCGLTAFASTQAEKDEKLQITGDYKIGIMTQVVAQSDENYNAAMAIQKAVGEDKVTVMTFPEKFATEQETSISTALSLASDPDIKAIVFSQGVQGTAAACQKIREIRPDILLIATAYQDDAAVCSENMDIFYHANIPQMGSQMVTELGDMGAKNFVHYSFPRHLAFQPVADRLQVMKDMCAEKGFELVETTTPDPTSDAGVSGTQQFVLEDVPRKVEEYGTETAFFGTNTAQQEPIISGVMSTKSYYTYASDPSPFVGYPGALGIEVPDDKLYDVDYMMEAIEEKVTEAGMNGHMGTWTAPQMTLFARAGFQYAVEYCEGKIADRYNIDDFKRCMEDQAGGSVDVQNITSGGATYDNGYFILCEYVRF